MAIINPTATATVYPAPYPLPDGVPVVSYPISGRHPNSAAINFLHYFLAVVSIAAFLITAFLAFSVWFTLRLRLIEFSVSSSTISNLNISLSPPQLSADFDITLSIHNPNNNFDVSYDEVTATVVYDRDGLAETTLPDFYQKKHNSTVLRVRLVAVSTFVEPDHPGQISGEVSRCGMVRSQVWVSGMVHFTAGAWKTNTRAMMVRCDDVAFMVYNGTRTVGSESGSRKSCTVKLEAPYA